MSFYTNKQLKCQTFLCPFDKLFCFDFIVYIFRFTFNKTKTKKSSNNKFKTEKLLTLFVIDKHLSIMSSFLLSYFFYNYFVFIIKFCKGFSFIFISKFYESLEFFCFIFL